MQRDERAYLNDIVEACAAIESALSGLDLAAYRADRLVRSAVEREFIIVGEAVAALSRLFGNSPEFWLNAQRAVDLWDAAQAIKADVDRIKPLSAA